MAVFFDVFKTSLPLLFEGAINTLWITMLAVFFGIIIGLVMGLGRLSKNVVIQRIATIYVDFIRGTPLLVQIFVIYFGIPNLLGAITGEQYPVNDYVAAIIACAINSGAYVAEIFRAGIQSIDRGQMEAARSLGMTQRQAMRYVILPQAFKVVVPPLGNEFIAMLKDTSLLSAIGIEELTRKGQLYIAVSFQPFPVYAGILLMYLVMTLTIARLVRHLERRLAVSDRRS